MFICGALTKRVQGPAQNRQTYVYRCDLDEGHTGLHVDNVLGVSWSDEDVDPEFRQRNELVPPACIHQTQEIITHSAWVHYCPTDEQQCDNACKRNPATLKCKVCGQWKKDVQ